jgi:hypothetical protein
MAEIFARAGRGFPSAIHNWPKGDETVSRMAVCVAKTVYKQKLIQSPQMTWVNISKTTTTSGTPSNHRMIGITPSDVFASGYIALPYNAVLTTKFQRRRVTLRLYRALRNAGGSGKFSRRRPMLRRRWKLRTCLDAGPGASSGESVARGSPGTGKHNIQHRLEFRRS